MSLFEIQFSDKKGKDSELLEFLCCGPVVPLISQ